MHQINTFQQVSAKQSIWQWLHPLRCYRKSMWFWHFFVIKPHFSPNRKIITAQCYARYLTRAWWSQQTYQHFFRQFIFQRVAFERRPILLASRIPQYQRLAHMTAHAKMSHLSVKTYSCFITYSNRAHTEQKYDTSVPSIFTLFPEIWYFEEQ